jgi:putative DNA primase/helicase
MKAETIAKVLGGRKTGGGWMAHCPAHDDREPSLSITDAKDGKVLVRCHAGCDQRQVIAALRSCRVWNTEGHHEGRSLRKTDHRRITAPDPEALKRTEAALAIWNASRPAVGTPVAIYLRSRGLIASPPPAIRFHAGLKQPTTKGRLSPL